MTFMGTFSDLGSAGQSVIPNTDNAYDLGSASKRWRVVYGVSFIGTTVRATNYKSNNDAAGLTIADTTGAVSIQSSALLLQNSTSVGNIDTDTSAGYWITRRTGNAGMAAPADGTNMRSLEFYTSDAATAGIGNITAKLTITGGATVPARQIQANAIITSKGRARNINSQSIGYTIVATDDVILATGGGGGITITLPAANEISGRTIEVIKVDSGAGAITVSRAGSDMIEGGTTKSLAAQYDKVRLVSNGVATWYDEDTGLI